MTPLQLAQQWAQENPAEKCILVVITKNSGRCNWCKRTGFYVDGGKTAQTRGMRKGGFNGLCSYCRQIFFKPVLVHAWVLNPDYGKKADEADCFYMHDREIAPESRVTACPACVDAHKLDTTPNKYRNGVYVAQNLPALAVRKLLPTHTLDTTI